MFSHNKNANTARLEDYFYTLIHGKVSNNVFLGELPSTEDIEWNDMVLIDCNLPIYDNGSHSDGTVYIFLYARPNPDGTKNNPRLIEMEDILMNLLDSSDNEKYKVVRGSNGADYDSAINWHRNFVYVDVTILS